MYAIKAYLYFFKRSCTLTEDFIDIKNNLFL